MMKIKRTKGPDVSSADTWLIAWQKCTTVTICHLDLFESRLATTVR